ncbi:MAG: hypothetical protein ACK5VV_11480 [Lysobacteraceae bacterium]
MKPCSVAAAVLVLCALASAVARGAPPAPSTIDETPHGLWQGMPVSELAALGLDRTRSFDGFEFVAHIPEAAPGPDFHLVAHSPATGLCAVLSVTGFSGDDPLSEARAEIQRRRASIRGSAGEEDLVKRIRPAFRDTLSPDPTLQGLAERHQFYAMHWEAPRHRLPPSISAVRLSLTSNGTVVFLNHRVEFANRKACLVSQIAERLPRFAGAAPLGVRPGADRSELRAMLVKEFADRDDFRSALPIVRTPGPEFAFASVLLSKDGGACGLVAKTSSFDEAGDGRFSRQVFDAYRQALTDAFGDAEVADGPRPGSGFRPEGDWVAALALGEWQLSAIWLKADGARLPEGLRGLGLWARAEDDGIPVVTLFYEFDNFDACVDQADREADEVL